MLTEFLAFARSKNPDTVYDYAHNQRCPFAQFLRAEKGFNSPFVTPSLYCDSDDPYVTFDMPPEIDEAIRNSEGPGSTWGQLVTRLEALDAV